MKKIFLALTLTLTLTSTSFALHEWYEGYKLEPYYYKSYNPLVIQYSNGLILDLVENRAVARGEYPIAGLLTYSNREFIESKAVENSIKELIGAVGELRLNTDERVYNLVKNDPDFAELIRQRIKKTVNILHYRIFTMRRTLRVTSSVKYKGPNSLLNIIYPYLIEREKGATVEAESEEILEESEDIWESEYKEMLENPPQATEELTYEALSSASVDFSNIEIKGTYTGLIIDARGLKLEPAIDPRIVDEAGNEVFGSISDFDINLLYKRGKTGYTRTIKAAYANYRAGKNPLVIKATKARRNCDPIVSAEDGYRILKENEKRELLGKLCVMFVI